MMTPALISINLHRHLRILNTLKVTTTRHDRPNLTLLRLTRKGQKHPKIRTRQVHPKLETKIRPMRQPMPQHGNYLLIARQHHRISTVNSTHKMHSRRTQPIMHHHLRRNTGNLHLIHTRHSLNSMRVTMNLDRRARILLTHHLAITNRLNNDAPENNLQNLTTNIKMRLNVRRRRVSITSTTRSIIRTTRTSIMNPTIATSSPSHNKSRKIHRTRRHVANGQKSIARPPPRFYRRIPASEGTNLIYRQKRINGRINSRILTSLTNRFSRRPAHLTALSLRTRTRTRTRLNIILRRKIIPNQARPDTISHPQHHQRITTMSQKTANNVNRSRTIARLLHRRLRVQHLATPQTNTQRLGR